MYTCYPNAAEKMDMLNKKKSSQKLKNISVPEDE